MQALNPLGVQYVGLQARTAPRKLARFHQVDLEVLRFKQLEQRDPVNSGRFQSDRLDSALLQPRGDLLKIDSVLATVGLGCRRGPLDADHMHVGMNVDSGRVWVDKTELARQSGTERGSSFSHGFLGVLG